VLQLSLKSLYLLTPKGEFQIREVQRGTKRRIKLRTWIIKNSNFSGEKNGIVYGNIMYK